MNKELLQKKMGYEFKNIALLKKALTHRSAGKNHNECLEFLGDSVLNCIIATALFCKFPNANEGQLTRMRANLINEKTLVGLAQFLNIDKNLILGIGESKNGGRKRSSILADCLEAIIAAIYLDSNFDKVSEIVNLWYLPLLENIELTKVIKDPKSELQELLQAKGQILPVYKVVQTTGQVHKREFTVECFVDFINKIFVGIGSSIRRAEQQAAANALLDLKQNGN